MSFPRAALAALALAGLSLAPPAQAAPQAFDPNDVEQAAYVDGNLIFLAYHEVAHLLLDVVADADQVSDRRASEELADDIATYLMLPDESETEQDDWILAAIKGWNRSAAMQDGVARSPHYPDDAERAARIACYLYGSNPKLYSSFTSWFPAALESVDCREEFAVLQNDLDAWFADSIVEAGAAPGPTPRVSYEPAPPNLEAARAYLENSGILEGAANDVAEFARVPDDVTFVGMSCGPGAAEFRYTPGARMVTACYEAVDWLMRDANDEEQEVATEQAITDGNVLGSGGSRVTQRPRVVRRAPVVTPR